MPLAGIREGKVGPDEGSENGPPEDGHRIATDQLADETQLTRLEDGHHVGFHQVQVLLTEFAGLIFDFAGVVADDEGRFAGSPKPRKRSLVESENLPYGP